MTEFEKAQQEYLKEFEIKYNEKLEQQNIEKKEEAEERKQENSEPTYHKWEQIPEDTHSTQPTQKLNSFLIAFGWWQIWAGLSLVLGTTFGLIYFILEAIPSGNGLLVFTIIIINIILSIKILNYNKYAFLIATILSFNPLLWIINGIYLKNRWKHPLVNNGIDLTNEEAKPTQEFIRPILNATVKTSERLSESFRSFKLPEQKDNQTDKELVELQELVNKAIAKGDTEMAQSLLKILERKKAV